MWPTYVFSLTVVCSWLMAVLAIRHPRWTSGVPAQAAYRRSAVSYCVWATFLVPQVYVALDRIAATPNGTRLLLAATAILGAYATQPWLHWFVPPVSDTADDGRVVQVHVIPNVLDSPLLLLGMLSATCLAFSLAERGSDLRSEPLNGAFLIAYGRDRWLLLFLLLSHGYVAAVYLRIVAAYWPVLRATLHRFPDPVARCRFQCSIYTTTLGLLYNLHELARALLYHAGLPAHPGSHSAIASLALAVYNVALLQCHYGSFRWLAHYLAYRQLAPLWWSLYGAIPTLAHRRPWSPRTDGVWLGPRAVGDRLRARIYAIWDGISTLYPHRPAALAAHARAACAAASLSEEDAVPIVEAVLLKASVAASRCGALPTTDRAPLPEFAQRSFGEQIAFLQRVAWAAARSPIVASVLADATSAEDDPAHRKPVTTRRTLDH